MELGNAVVDRDAAAAPSGSAASRRLATNAELAPTVGQTIGISGSDVMNHRATSQHVLMEHETLKHLTGALRHTIGWKQPGDDLCRKLSSLRFVAQSFQRHLQRLMALEEEDGYLAVVIESRPQLNNEVATLGQQHDEFRARVRSILDRLDCVAPADHAAFRGVCDDLLALLQTVDDHGKKESDLIQKALLQDEGGEG
jgi:hypothetical protein